MSKKSKQSEKKKDRRRARRRVNRKAKAAAYAEDAYFAFTDQQYKRAFDYAMKGLRLQPINQECYYYAWMAANNIQPRDRLFTALKHGWDHKLIKERQHLSVLGMMAYDRQQYPLAKEVLQAFINNPDNLPQQHDLTQALTSAKIYLTLSKEAEHQPPSKPPSSQPTSSQKSNKPEKELEPGENSPETPPEPEDEPLPELEMTYEIETAPILQAIEDYRSADPARLELILNAYRLSFRSSYDQLLCLNTLREVESLWYQEETARKVLKTFRGRAILADEVGLGKTIEAGLILKEYIMRGLVKTALILAPSSLVDQWHEELDEKFGLSFITSNDPLFRENPERFWKQPYLLVSLHTARMKRHFDTVTARSYDMVIVDEAHHLKNRTTRNWKLVNALQKTFLLLLTATPVQNKLEELYNLVTLLKPGHLSTRKAFMAQFVARGNPTDPINREKLRELLKEVMVRNTRSVAQLRLPPRFAMTVQIQPTAPEVEFYEAISRFVAQKSAERRKGVSRMVLKRLLEAAGSSHIAALSMLENMQHGDRDMKALLKLGNQIDAGGKLERVLELLRTTPEQKILFVNYLHTLDYLDRALTQHNLSHVVYKGGMTPAKKHKVIDQFRQGCPILLATDTGGEGHNLQFCHTMINYDLPWNPMRIEQRIGRIHRFGQEHEVQIYNFCASGSIEDHILEILDRKINMFELVVGEIDMILGRLKGEAEFDDLVYELWLQHDDSSERKKAFSSLGTRMKRARTAYEKSKELDEKLFREDFGV